ncbi:MAG: CinA family protein [candidate division WOR-3 bacterium]
MKRLLSEIARRLIKKRLTLGVCESCTGGMLGSIITSQSGSSKYFKGGIIAYSNEVKGKVVGVKKYTLKKFGAVSEETAGEMACGVRRKLGTDIGIGITGIAGPTGGTKEKPVGLVYISVCSKLHRVIKRYIFKGTRELIRKRACRASLEILKEFIQKTVS